MKMFSNDILHETFAIILEVTDSELGFIEDDPARIYNPHVMLELMKSKGNNAHIVQLSVNSITDISDKIYKLLAKYQTVSWVNENKKFFIKRNVTALLN